MENPSKKTSTTGSYQNKTKKKIKFVEEMPTFFFKTQS